MADPFDTIDTGQDFEDYAVGLAPVTIKEINPDTGATITTVSNLPAVKLPRKREPFGVGGGEVAGDECQFTFRANELGFDPKARDQIVEADGTVWTLTAARLFGFDALCTADASRKRG